VQFSHNASVNASTGFTPSKIVLGKNLQLPDDLVAKEKQRPKRMTLKEQMEQEEDERLDCVKVARENVQESRGKRNELLLEKANGVPYKVGDRVRYKLNPDVRSKKGGKIAQRYSEVYIITEVKPNRYTYMIRPEEETSRGQRKQRHFNQLKTVEKVNGEVDVQDELVSNGAGNDARVEPEEDEAPGSSSSTIERNTDPPDSTTQLLRRSNRTRTNTKFLQADGRNKVYSESEVTEEQTDTE
jgi:hypothetical protein